MRIAAGDKPLGLSYPLDKVKSFLRVTGTDQDGDISSMINASTSIIAHHTDVELQSRTFTGYLDSWEAESTIYKYPVTAITSVKYYDTSNVLQTLSTSDYYTDINTTYSRINFPTQPSLYDDRYNKIEILFSAGYSDWHDIPDEYVQLLELVVSYSYNHRGAQAEDMPQHIKTMLLNHSKRAVL